MSGLTVKNLEDAFERSRTTEDGTMTLEEIRAVLVQRQLWDKPLEDLLANMAADDDNCLLSRNEVSSIILRVAGRELQDGESTDRGAADLQCYICSIREVFAGEYGLPKAKRTKPALEGMVEVLNPYTNPSAYRICQKMVLSGGVATPLLGLARLGPTDEIRVMALDVLTLAMFGNEAWAAAVAMEPEFLCTVADGLQNGKHPEKLSVLQFAQAVAASPCEDVRAVLPALLQEVRPLLDGQPYQAITAQALDVLICGSFQCPDEVAQLLCWPLVASMVVEGASRLEWLSPDPLCILSCGLMGANLLSAASPVDECDKAARLQLISNLFEGHFLGSLALALEAAVSRREWPVGSGVYHSPRRLAIALQRLAAQGFPVPGTEVLLAKAIESSADACTIREALRALFALCVTSVDCLEALLSLSSWRTDTLDLLCSGDDNLDAMALQSYLCAAEQHFEHANSVLAVLQMHNQGAPAPNVSHLARVFARHARFNEDLTREQLIEALPAVPVGPPGAVCLPTKAGRLSFSVFAEHIYGTHKLLGLWPSLMEDVAALVEQTLSKKPSCLPALSDLVALFAHYGDGGLTPDRLVSDVLPVAGFPSVEESEVVYEAYANIRGDGPLTFKAFISWMCGVAVQLPVLGTETSTGTGVAFAGA